MNSALRRIIVLGTPLILGILTVTHPVISDKIGVFHSILPRVDWWISLHILLLPLFCIIALATYLLIDGRQGVVATISRIAIGIFVIFYPALDSILGIGTGILVHYAAGLPPSQQAMVEKSIDAVWQSPIVSLIGDLGSLGWIVGVLTAAIALSRPSKSCQLVTILTLLAVLFGVWSQIVFIEPFWWIGVLILAIALGLATRPHLPVGLLVLAAFLFGTDHAPPYGPLGMACFFLAALQFELLTQQKFDPAEPELVIPTSFALGNDL